MFDLVIVGGGLVGAGLAAALADADLRIALIESKLPSLNDPRLFGLNYSSCQFLRNIGLWPQLMEVAAVIHEVHVSRRGHFGALRLNHQTIDLPYLGYVIPAYQIEIALQQLLSNTKNCTIFRPANLTSLAQQDEDVQLKIVIDGIEQAIHSRIVIAADGTASSVRQHMNIASDTVNYQQSAIVTRTQLTRAHQNIAYERFQACGAVAMLPLPEQQCATIWTTEKAHAEELMQLDEQQFLNELQKAFGYRLGRLNGICARHHFPLNMVRAHKMVKESVMLLGNAAQTLHPIAAQGFNLAVYEVATLAEAILAKNKQDSAFDAKDLLAVSQCLHTQKQTSTDFSHYLANAFLESQPLKNAALQCGMVGIDLLPPLKKKLLQKLLGRSGRTPQLLLSP